MRVTKWLSVCKITEKRAYGFGWNVACRPTDVVTWTNWLTFEPDPDHSPDAGTGLLFPIAYALQRGILLRLGKSHVLVLWARRSSDAWFWGVETPLSEVKCALPSALLVAHASLLQCRVARRWYVCMLHRTLGCLFAWAVDCRVMLQCY